MKRIILILFSLIAINTQNNAMTTQPWSVSITLGFSITINGPAGQMTSCIPYQSICNITYSLNATNCHTVTYNDVSNELTLVLVNSLIPVEDYNLYLKSNIFKIVSKDGSLGFQLNNELKSKLGLKNGLIPNGEYQINHSNNKISTITFKNIK